MSDPYPYKHVNPSPFFRHATHYLSTCAARKITGNIKFDMKYLNCSREIGRHVIRSLLFNYPEHRQTYDNTLSLISPTKCTISYRHEYLEAYLWHVSMQVYHFQEEQNASFKTNRQCRAIIYRLNTYLLTPWSRVLLEKPPG